MARSPSPLRRAVFLDRDGTFIEDADFLREPSQIRPLPGAAEALKLLRAAGFLVVVTTNQSGVARGFFTEKKLAEIHDALRRRFADEGAPFDAIYYCPHLPDGTVAEFARECDCRKPQPGMLLRAAKDLRIALPESFAIGDSERDVESGRRAGCRTVLVAATSPERTVADAVAPSLLDAVRLVLSWS